MTLASGVRLGAYEILGALGAGGMGEVYRARDTKLGRDVAIKVLPPEVAREPERLARFQREAHLLASLNHPNIAAIYGLEEADGKPFLVLELVEGEELAARLKRGPIPVEEALGMAKQIAEGLEEAHEKGIVHRDLKPANVKLTAEGKVKVLDFGLAKAYAGDPAGGGSAELSRSPTWTQGGTEAGAILGTAAYMSPEQARGKTVDRRADVWAFGVVLFEMLTGRRLFEGETVADVLAAVVKEQPEWAALPQGTPARIRELVRRCLAKDPRKRLQAIGEARLSIEETLGGVPEAFAPAVAAGRTAPAWRRALPWVLASGLGLLALWALWPRAAPRPAPPLRLSVALGADAWLVAAEPWGPAAILSPDGALLAFVAQKRPSEAPQLYVRRLEHLQASPLPGTEGARSPFFSPDGQWIAFFAEGKVKKVAVTGGAAVTLCDVPDNRGGSWAEDGTIVFTPGGAPGVGLSRVSSAGGTPEVLTKPDPVAGEVTHRWPQVLPGGRAVLYTASATTGSFGRFEDAAIVAQPLPSGPRKILLQRGGYHGRYLPSGHLVYIHEGTLFAAAFDLGRLELTGPPAPALEGVTSSSVTAGAQFAYSDRGDLVYLTGGSVGGESSIDWIDSAGKTQPLRAVLGAYDNPRFSPDGRRLAVDIGVRNQLDVWVYEWGRDTLSRLTFDRGNDTRPVWSPDGRRIAFASERADKGTLNLYWQRADGTGEAERLTESKSLHYPTSWHPSGRFLAFFEGSAQTNFDVLILPVEGNEASGWKPGKPTVFLNTPFSEANPEFSPDGRWLAYQSNESGRFEVYVRPFISEGSELRRGAGTSDSHEAARMRTIPGPDGKWQVSTEGGHFPTWSRTRRELFYRTDDQRIMVARYAAEGDSFRAERPRVWSEGQLAFRMLARNFDLHPDGLRFAALRAPEAAEAKQDHVVLILNFFDELRRVAPAEGVR